MSPSVESSQVEINFGYHKVKLTQSYYPLLIVIQTCFQFEGSEGSDGTHTGREAGGTDDEEVPKRSVLILNIFRRCEIEKFFSTLSIRAQIQSNVI